MEYPGYVYHPYPKMIYNKEWPLGYKIVKSEAEEQALTKVPDQAPKKVQTKKLKLDMED